MAVTVAVWPCCEARAQVQAPAPEKLAIGDWKLAPVVEARARGEVWRDFDDFDRGVAVERFRLGVDMERGAIEARVVLQDARAWTTDPSLGFVATSRAPATGAYEGWVQASTSSAHPSFVRIGRQPVTWGEGRLLGVADWSPAARSLDAVRGRLVAGDWAFELLAASLLDPAQLGYSSYAGLFGGRAEWAIDPLLAFEAYALARIAAAEPAASLGNSVRGETYTGSLRAHGDSRGWTWGAEGAYQFGRAADLGLDRGAWAAAGHVAYTMERVVATPTLRLGASYASGYDGKGPTYSAFDPLLPDVHAWHGAMDLFSWSNEEEGSARVTIVPWTDAHAGVEYRYARLVEPAGGWRTAYLATMGPVAGSTDAELGHEVDAWLAWAPWSPMELAAGYSALVLGDGARANLAPLAAPGVVRFGYVQATLRVP